MVVLQGAARAAKKNHEAMLFQAWHTEAFARTKKLPKLTDILGEKRKAQTPEEMLDVFRQFQARGAGMTIRQLN